MTSAAANGHPCPHLYIAPDDPVARRIGMGAPALRYAAIGGLEVLQLKPGTKRPAAGHGVLDATADPAVIGQLWAAIPAGNVGIKTERLLVFDGDRKSGADGIASLLGWLAERSLQLPPLPWAGTPNNGTHLFLQLPPGYAVPSRAGVLPGLDIRGAGGYVAAWPSHVRLRVLQRPGEARETTPVLGTYTWHGCPCQMPVAPDALLDALAGLPGTGNGSGGAAGNGTGAAGDLPPTPVLLEHGVPHGHDDNLSRLAARLCGEGMTEAEAHVTWRALADRTKDPGDPFTDADFRRHWRGAERKGFGEDAAAGAQVTRWAASVAVSVDGGEEEKAPAEGTPKPGKRPPRPGLDSLTARILSLFEFARDMGGELFLLPGPQLRAAPYIPRSFLTQDVVNLGHLVWRGMAKVWNAWVDSLSDAERKALEVTRANLTPSDTTIRNAARHLEAIGMASGRKVDAALRAVRAGDGIAVDLGDDTGLVAYVTARGWQVMDPRDLPVPPPVFRRSVGYSPLPHPLPGGDLGRLWDILRVRGDSEEGKAVRALAAGWLVAAYFADVPRPGTWFTGPPGGGKTTAACALARLIDGTDWLDGKMDRTDERNNIIRAAKCFIPSFDNMTSVTPEQSDWVCGMVTGRRDMFRKMRTNFDDVSLAYRRTFTATGLSLPYGLAADALDRIIDIPFTRIEEDDRVSDAAIRRELDAARPELLGAVLSHVAAVLAVLPRIPENQGGLARMNGYARILKAHDMACGTGWLVAYQGSVKMTRADKAGGEPVVLALAAWLAPGSEWRGTPTALLDALGAWRPVTGWWPADGRSLSGNLDTNDALLAGEGIRVTRSPDRRTIYLKRE